MKASILLFKSALVTILFGGCLSLYKQTIPDYLLECYNDSTTMMPMTMEIFISIIKKIEMSPYFLMDINEFVPSLLHRFWRDGIVLEKDIILVEPEVIPFKTTGFQRHKYEIIMKNMIPGTARSFPDGTLTSTERCTLHSMLSGSIDIWERGNEYSVCKNYISSNSTKYEPSGFRKSSCPIEKGVVLSREFGTISPSHILTAIATFLRPMIVPMSYLMRDRNEQDNSRSIDNKWITLSGDLAETLIMQTPLVTDNYEFGPQGKWNDSYLPVEYYLTLSKEGLQNKFWQYTDAEILGTLDGLIMAKEAENWENKGNALRLSQLLEAYYSPTYTSIISVNACERKTHFESITSQTYIIEEQVKNFAEVLAQNMPNYLNNISISDMKMKQFLNDFNSHVSNLIWSKVKCPEGIQFRPKLDISVIVDNTWTSFETLQFLMTLGRNMEVSPKGSKISVITGNNGELITSSESMLGNVFLQWKDTSIDGTPSLPRSLITLRDKINYERSLTKFEKGPFSHVTIIIGTSTILGSAETSDSITLLNSIRNANPDMVFIYVSSTALAPMYVKLTSTPDSQNDKIIVVEHNNQGRVLNELGILKQLPRAIRTDIWCRNLTRINKPVEIKNYANPGIILFYRIHPYYLCSSSNIHIEIENSNKGNLIACLSRDENEQEKLCKDAALSEKITFDLNSPCQSEDIYRKDESWNDNCKPIYIKILGKRSLSTCSETECRTPDDIPFAMLIEGMRCIGTKYLSCNSAENLKFTMHTIVLFSLLLLIANYYREYL